MLKACVSWTLLALLVSVLQHWVRTLSCLGPVGDYLRYMSPRNTLVHYGWFLFEPSSVEVGHRPWELRSPFPLFYALKSLDWWWPNPSFCSASGTSTVWTYVRIANSCSIYVSAWESRSLIALFTSAGQRHGIHTSLRSYEIQPWCLWPGQESCSRRCTISVGYLCCLPRGHQLLPYPAVTCLPP